MAQRAQGRREVSRERNNDEHSKSTFSLHEWNDPLLSEMYYCVLAAHLFSKPSSVILARSVSNRRVGQQENT